MVCVLHFAPRSFTFSFLMANPSAPSPRRRRRGKYYLIGGIVLIVLMGVAGAMKNRGKSQGTLVTVSPVELRTLTQVVTATGRVRPEVEVKIAPEVSGEIIELPLREGAAVKRGELLVRIRDDNYRFQVDQREADLAAARAVALQNQANQLKAEADYQRSRDLHERQLISPSEFLAAETALAVARANHESALANIRRAEGQLSQARDQLEKTTIFAPIDGTVSRLDAEVGERVAGTGQFNAAVIMHVADLATMEVVVDVNENDVVRVKIGDTATLMVDALPDRPLTGRVTEIASTARTSGANTQDQVTNFEVRIRVEEPGEVLRPGMSATADIATQTVTEAVAVPIQSVTVRSRDDDRTLEQVAAARAKEAKETTGEGAATAVNEREQRARLQRDRAALQRVVFVVEGDRVKQVAVETGIADATHMEIKSGLEVGQRVVSGNFNTITRVLRDDMAVRVERPRAARQETTPQ